jgi:hypothetical protein
LNAPTPCSTRPNSRSEYSGQHVYHVGSDTGRTAGAAAADPAVAGIVSMMSSSGSPNQLTNTTRLSSEHIRRTSSWKASAAAAAAAAMRAQEHQQHGSAGALDALHHPLGQKPAVAAGPPGAVAASPHQG